MPRIIPELLSQLHAAIFDIDGTMIDSMQYHLKVWQTIADKYGCNLTMKEVGEKAYGINPEILERIFPGQLSAQQKEEIANEKENLFRSVFNPEEHVIKGFIHFIDELHKLQIPMVIGSAAPEENIDYFMDRLGIRTFFKGVIHEDRVKAGKPDPDVFIKSAKLTGLPVDQCVVFEDSPSGAEASSKAGSRTVAILSTKSKSDFKEIPGIIAYAKDYTELMEK